MPSQPEESKTGPLQVHAEHLTRTREMWVQVALQSQDSKVTYASTTTWVSSLDWELRNATLSPLETAYDARLSISFQVCAQPLLCLHNLLSSRS